MRGFPLYGVPELTLCSDVRDRVLDAHSEQCYWYIASKSAYETAQKAKKTKSMYANDSCSKH